MPIKWCDDDDGLSSDGAETSGFRCVVAKIRFATEGEAEGGLGALLRFLAATRGVVLSPPSPGGFYLQAQTEGGRWETSGPFASLAEAKAAFPM